MEGHLEITTISNYLKYLSRSAYDLTQHTKATGVKLCAEKKLPAPIKQSVTEIVPNKGPIGKAFKKVSQSYQC